MLDSYCQTRLSSSRRSALPLRSQPVHNDLMHDRIGPQRGQIDGGIGHVKWIDLLASENLSRRSIHEVIRDGAGTNGADLNMEGTALIGQGFGQRHDAMLRRAVG